MLLVLPCHSVYKFVLPGNINNFLLIELTHEYQRNRTTPFERVFVFVSVWLTVETVTVNVAQNPFVSMCEFVSVELAVNERLSE